jgi:hypothetical protein
VNFNFKKREKISKTKLLRPRRFLGVVLLSFLLLFVAVSQTNYAHAWSWVSDTNEKGEKAPDGYDWLCYPNEATGTADCVLHKKGTPTGIIGGLKSLPHQATGALTDWVGEKIVKGIIFILSCIAWFCKMFAQLAGKFLDYMLDPSLYNLTTQPLIKMGWIIVRDVCNLFFLIILLFIAFCTILQVDKYHAKKTLLVLILMALLINFSKPIAIFIFDGSQLLMNYFVKLMTKAGNPSDKLASVSNIAETIYAKSEAARVGGGESKSIVVYYLFTIVFLFTFAVALLVMSIFLLIRLVAMWIIVIVSPAAFLATAVPDLKKMSNDWWDALFKYSYTGPVMAFFLYLATKLAVDGIYKKFEPNITLEGFSFVDFFPFMVVIAFLYTSLIVSQKLGIAFAGSVTGRANKTLGWGARHLSGYSLAAKGGRGIANIYKRHKSAATEAGKEALKQKYPRAHRWLTKEGADAAAQKFWGEKVFKTKDPHRQQQENVAKHEKDMKDKNFTEADYQKELKSADATRRMAAAMALVKMGKLDFKQYKEALSDFEKNPAFQKLFDNEVKKKSIHVAIDAEIESETKRLGRSLNTTESQAIYDKHLSTIKPSDIADQNVGELMNRREFVEFANDNYSTMSPGVKSDLAKKLSANDLWKFQGMGWV